MYEQDEEYLDEGEDGDEISNEIWQEVGDLIIRPHARLGRLGPKLRFFTS